MSERETLRDQFSTVIGFVQTEGTKQILWDRYGFGWSSGRA